MACTLCLGVLRFLELTGRIQDVHAAETSCQCQTQDDGQNDTLQEFHTNLVTDPLVDAMTTERTYSAQLIATIVLDGKRFLHFVGFQAATTLRRIDESFGMLQFRHKKHGVLNCTDTDR